MYAYWRVLSLEGRYLQAGQELWTGSYSLPRISSRIGRKKARIPGREAFSRAFGRKKAQIPGRAALPQPFGRKKAQIPGRAQQSSKKGG